MSDHPDEIRKEQRLWGIPTMVCARQRGDLVLHAAAAEIEGGAVLLAAPGRFGKTTLALALHRSGYRLLTEDTACCTSSSAPELYPGPTSVRLRPDMFDGVAPADQEIMTGTFWFKDAATFLSEEDAMEKDDDRVNGEFYIDTIVKRMVERGARVAAFTVEKVLSWGTPEELKTFEYYGEVSRIR